MRTEAEIDDPQSRTATGTTDADGADQTVSDEATQRLFKGVMVVMAAAIVLGLFGAAALWALSGDDEPNLPMNAVDVGFLQDMIDHHEQALVISNIYLDDQPNGDAAPYAREVVLFQTRDLEWMRDWLAEEGYAEGEPDRMAMEWMNEPTPVAEMTGMQSQEQLDELAAASGTDADRLFFLMMSDHHFGGVHMADYAAANGADQEIIEFAEYVSRGQKIEVVEYIQAMERLGLR
ncbi:MAG: DUF305 domain-containing protein [Ilumatobacteraceae bacterium]